MIKNKTIFWTVLLVFALLLAACGSAPPEAEATPQPDVVLTAAAQTAEARLTELAQPTATPTETQVPTLALSPPPTLDLALTPTVDLALTPSLPVGTTPTAPVVVTTPGTGASGDLAEYVADITIPDGEDMDPGEAFTKVWRLRNAGTTTWTIDYQFVFIGGAQMDAPSEVPIPQSVAPGATVDISVSMVAPQQNGLQRGFWQMRNPAGTLFQSSVYVEIEVVGGSAAATGSSSSSGDGQVSNVSLSVDDNSPGECPYTFTFTSSFELDEAATVRYRLDAGTDTAGFTFDLPGEQPASLEAGSHTVPYTLEVTDTVDGWAEFHLLEPVEVTSNQVTFSLDCDD